MSYTLPSLPYAYDALEPHFDKQTMEIHHTKHHQTYVNNANAALESLPEFANLSAEELITKLDQLPADKKTVLRNNAGGHANHSLFLERPENRHHPAGRPESGYRARFRLCRQFQSGIRKSRCDPFRLRLGVAGPER